jgi:DNA invertase Pin-like site-specific DNA recombinase
MEDIPMHVGYARVSTQDQDLTVQRERLAHCEKLFEETASGASDKRPQLQVCLDYVREGDTLTVTRLDRLARSTLHLCQIADLLARKGVHLHVLDQEVNTHTSTGRLLFGMLSVIAQFELELRAERQREGIAKAKRAGVRFGRDKALTPAQAAMLRAQRAAGVTLLTLQRQYGLGKTAVYRYLKQSTDAHEVTNRAAAD